MVVGVGVVVGVVGVVRVFVGVVRVDDYVVVGVDDVVSVFLCYFCWCC